MLDSNKSTPKKAKKTAKKAATKKAEPKKNSKTKKAAAKEKKKVILPTFKETSDDTIDEAYFADDEAENDTVTDFHEEIFDDENPEEDLESPLKTLFAKNQINEEIEEDDEEIAERKETARQEGLEYAPKRDVFLFGAQECTKHSDIAKYKIKKNGEYIGDRRAPYSWEKLQKEFGGGQYVVMCYRSSGMGPSHGYIMSQTELVADLPVKEHEESEPKEKAANSQIELIHALKEMFAGNQSASAEEVRAKSDAKLGETSMMMQMMQQMNQQNVQMMTQMQKSSDQRFEMMMQMQLANKKSDDGLGIKDILTLVTSSKKSGAEDFKSLFEMAKELAEDMQPSSKEKDPSPTDAIIASLPALVTAWSQRPPTVNAAPRPVQQLQQPQQRPLNSGAGAVTAGRPQFPNNQQQPNPQQGEIEMGKSTRQPLAPAHAPKKAGTTVRPVPGHQEVAPPTPRVEKAIPPGGAQPLKLGGANPNPAQPGNGAGTLDLDLSEEDTETSDLAGADDEVALNPGEEFVRKKGAIETADGKFVADSSWEKPEQFLSEKTLDGEINEAGDGVYVNDEEASIDVADGKYVRSENDATFIEAGKDYKAQVKLLDLVQNDVVSGFMSGYNAKKIVTQMMATLENNLVPADQVLKAFPNEATLLNVALMKGMPSMFQHKLKELYAVLGPALKQKVAIESTGVST